MAANIVWNGTTGNITTAGNWIGGVAPVAVDTAIFNRGTQSIDPNLGNIAALAGVEIYPGYGGDIGAVGNIMTTSITTLKHLGRAALWVADSAGVTTDVFIRTVDNNVVVNLGGDTMTNVTLLRGNVTIATTIGAITRLEVGHAGNRENDVRLMIVAGGTAVALAQQWGGQITGYGTITSLYQCAGLTVFPVGSVGNATNLYQTGGRLNHYTTETIALAHVAGVLDLGQAAKTISKSTRYPGGRIIKQADTIHTFTAAIVDLAEVA